MEEEKEPEAFTAADLIADLGGPTPVKEEKPEDPPTPEDEAEVPAGAEPESEEGKGQEETEGDRYAKITDMETAIAEIARLDSRLESKDKGYEQVRPYIDLGKLFDQVQTDPVAARELVADLVKTHSLNVAPAVETEEFALPETVDPDDKPFLEDLHSNVIAPYVAHAMAKRDARIAELEKSLKDLSDRVTEPLTQYESSRQSKVFDSQVEAAAPEALRIYQLRTKATATKDDLKAAMAKYPKALESGEMKPVDALEQFMRHKKPTEAPKPKKDLPTMARPVAQGSKQDLSGAQSTKDLVDKWFDANEAS